MTAKLHFNARKTAAITLYVFVWFLIIELCLALLVPAPQFERITVSDGKGSQYELSTNRQLLYVPRPDTGDFNSGGYRGKLHPITKTGKATRVVFMGDSVAEGLGVEPEERFTELLQDKLGESFEIINLSVRGYNLLQEMEYLKSVGLEYAPDEVVFTITYNDLQLHGAEVMDFCQRMDQSRQSPFYRTYYTSGKRVEGFMLKSNIYRHIRYRQSCGKSLFDSMKYVMTAGQTKDTIRTLQDISLKHGFHLSFVFLPINTSTTGQMEMIKNVVKSEKLPFFDAHTYMRAIMNGGKTKELFADNDPCHLNAAGHRHLAESLYDNMDQLMEE